MLHLVCSASLRQLFVKIKFFELFLRRFLPVNTYIHILKELSEYLSEKLLISVKVLIIISQK